MRPSGIGLQLDEYDAHQVYTVESHFELTTLIECLRIVVDLVRCSTEESMKIRSSEVFSSIKIVFLPFCRVAVETSNFLCQSVDCRIEYHENDSARVLSHSLLGCY